MNKIIIFVLLLGLVLGVGLYLVKSKTARVGSELNSEPENARNYGYSLTIKSNTMQITSTAFKNNEKLPVKYTCDGEAVNPPLLVDELPENTKSLALVVDDPDAPSGTFTHWTVWNISPGTREIPENSVPAGSVQGATSTGKPGYVGPCPPTGTHRYFFKLYALDTELQLDSNGEIAELAKAMEGHVIESAEMMGRYSR